MARHRAVPRTGAGPTLIGVAFVAAIAGIIRATRPILNGPDPFWHWDLGRRIASTWSLPREDPYSFLTSGQDWVLNQWGTDLLIGLIDRTGGLWLLAAVAGVAVMAGTGLTAREVYRRAPSLLAIPLLALVMLAGMSSWALRGNLATLILLPLVLRALRRGGPPRPWVLGGLFVLWANMHAAFLLGVGLVLIDRLGTILAADPQDRGPALRTGAPVVAAVMVAPLLNPYGPRYLTDVLSLALRGPATGISEWSAPELLGLRFIPFTILAVVVLVAVGVAAKHVDLPDILLIVCGTFVGLMIQRGVALGAIVVGIVGAPYVLKSWQIVRHGSAELTTGHHGVLDRGVAMGVLAVGLAGILVLVPRGDTIDLHASDVPLALIRELDALDRPARVVVTAGWAPAVSTLTGADVKTEVDGRAELFTDDQFERHIILHRGGPGWNDTLDEWCATDAVVTADSPLAELLDEEQAWTIETSGEVILGAADRTVRWYVRSAGPGTCDFGPPLDPDL